MLRLVDRLSFAVIGALAIALIAVLAGVVDAGPLDPTGPPGSTMQTLDNIPGAWSRELPANNGPAGGCNSSRFLCVMNDEAVLDRETGLVWDRTPSTSESGTWFSMSAVCYDTGVHDRLGWRMPTAEELASIVDFNETEPAPPAGHPFILIGSNGNFWTSTTFAGNTELAILIEIMDPAGYSIISETKGTAAHVWCVRGGQQHDGM